jgi:hypothetical protein
MNLFITNREQMMSVIIPKIMMVAENNVILDTPQKPKTTFQFETPDTSHQSLRQFKDTFLFLSPATQKFHDSIEKATKLSEVVNNTRTLREVQKILLIQLITS